MANRRLPLGPRRVKVASFTNPREGQPPRHLLCYIVTRKLRFYKQTPARAAEPQRLAFYLNSCLPAAFPNARPSREISRAIPKIPYDFRQIVKLTRRLSAPE